MPAAAKKAFRVSSGGNQVDGLPPDRSSGAGQERPHRRPDATVKIRRLSEDCAKPLNSFEPRQFFPGRLDLAKLSVKFPLPNFSELSGRVGPSFAQKSKFCGKCELERCCISRKRVCESIFDPLL